MRALEIKSRESNLKTMLKIYTDNAPILRKKASKVSLPPSTEIKKLLLDMKETACQKDGIGLAAPQVGKSVRAIIVNLPEKKLMMINPKITRRSFRKDIMEEGCLSLPGKFVKVKRPKKIMVKYFDENGKKLKLKANGLVSRVIQHEVDHLNGVLITDYKK